VLSGAAKRRRAPSGEWTPASATTEDGISPSGWWDASTLGLANGDPVELWPDLSGNGIDLAQSAEVLKPTFKTTGDIAHPCVQGYGNERLDNFTAGLSTVGGAHLFLVSCTTDTTLSGYRGIFCGAQNYLYPNNYYNGNSPTGIGITTSSAYNEHFGSSVSYLGTFKENRWEPYSIDVSVLHDMECLDGEPGYMKWTRNNLLVNNTEVTGTGNEIDWVSLPGRADYDQDSPAGVEIYEAIWYPAPLSVADALQVRQYLAAKYGITLE
jgi:hypothetical protein